MPQTNGADTIARICGAIEAGHLDEAAQIGRAEYPWTKKTLAKRSYSKISATRIFRRDGFIDRYFGSRLVYPGTLLLIAQILPDEFPAHTTWKVSESHEVYWELWPAVDHVVPLSRGGSSEPDNLVSTSTLHNNAKGHWLPDELGWKLHPPGNLNEWDGLLSWFIQHVEANPKLLEKGQIKDWYRAATRVSLANPAVNKA